MSFAPSRLAAAEFPYDEPWLPRGEPRAHDGHMPYAARLFAVLLIAAIGALAAYPPPSSAAQEVLIYRCVGADGQLTLRDSPCGKGETQETRTMLRPKDPPARTEAAQPAAPIQPPPPAAPPRVVYATPPRPMYECVTPEGERYTSDSDEGNPRWQPFWTVGYPVWPRGSGASVSGNVSIGNGNLSFSSGSPTPLPPRSPHPHPPGHGVVLPAGGVWIRDRCHPLPQQEVCARLSDRRYDILRRYNSAMPSERRELELEQRGIDARMASDCVD